MSYIDDLPSKSQIFNYWKRRIFHKGLFIDWGEPGCWACGFHYNDKYDIKNPNASWDKILQCWDKIPLQRCHIVSRSLGGTNKISNLFLMCRECHDLAPNTNIPEIFFEWAKAQSYHTRCNLKIRDALNSFGIEETEQNVLNRLITSKEFRSWMEDKIGLHRPQSKYATVESRITPATMVGLAIHYHRNIMSVS